MEQKAADSDRPVTLSADRIGGIDLARSLAILGMCLVHFLLVGAKLSSGFDLAIDGRPAAVFVVLSGIGITLFAERTMQKSGAGGIRDVRQILMRRGVVLLVLGFLNLVIWPGDILRVYGVALMVAAWLIDRSRISLLFAAATSVLVFLVLLGILNFEQNWDWETLHYHHLWTASGLLRNLFFDGFRTVFPWAGLIFYGMWLGRLDLHASKTCWRLFLIGTMIAVATELLSRSLVNQLLASPGLFKPEEVKALFGTGSMPPLPLFLLSAGATATAVVGACLLLPINGVLKAVAAPGRMALSWYLLHIVIGLGAIVVLGWEQSCTMAQAIVLGTLFWIAAVGLSAVYLRRFKTGPAETILRSLAG